jgi:hypothetical protein
MILSASWGNLVKPADVHKLLDDVLKSRSAEQVVAALEGLRKNIAVEPTVLTIIANAGVHEIPQLYLRGDVYEASRGDWDASTEEALLLELKAILSRLASKLRSQRWSRVYLIPTGHPVLSLQIKSMVYRLLRFNTIDLYHKAGAYFEVNLDQRAIALEPRDRVET